MADDNPTSKPCLSCGMDKPLDAYHRHKAGRYGRKPRCKACQNYTTEGREEVRTCEGCGFTFTVPPRARTRVCSLTCRWWIDPNRPKALPVPYWRSCRGCGETFWSTPYRARCPQCADLMRAQRQALARERRAQEREERLRAQPPRQCPACGADYRPAHGRQKYCSKPCARRMTDAVRRAYRKSLERGAQGAFTLNQWGRRLIDYDRRCAYCRDPDAIVEIEHVTPLSRGGSNRIANIVPACSACNNEKGALTPQEWLDSGRPRVAAGIVKRHESWPTGYPIEPTQLVA